MRGGNVMRSRFFLFQLFFIVFLSMLSRCTEDMPPEPPDNGPEGLTQAEARDIVTSEVLQGDLSGIDWGYISSEPLPPQTLLFADPDSIYTPNDSTWLVVLYRNWFAAEPEAQWILVNSTTGEYEVQNQDCLCLADRAAHNPPPAFTGFHVPDVSPGDPEPASDTLAIYMTQNSMSQQNALDSLRLAEPPLLTAADMTGYIWCTHTVQYPDSVYERILQYTDLLGRRFVLVSDSTRLYWGVWMFYTHDYFGPEPVIITWPVRAGNGFNYVVDTSLTIHRSYNDGIWLEEDPRFDDRIFNTLRQWKLVQPYKSE